MPWNLDFQDLRSSEIIVPYKYGTSSPTRQDTGCSRRAAVSILAPMAPDLPGTDFAMGACPLILPTAFVVDAL
jgi:hypothetical protein